MAEPSWWDAPAEDAIWDPSASADWVELAAQDQPGSGGSYAYEDAVETIVGHIPSKKKYDARRKILGYSYADDASPWELHRVHPLQHPDERHMRAVTVDMAGFNLLGRVLDEEAEYPELVGYDAPLVSGTFGNRPRYSRQLCSVKFRAHPHDFLSDADMTDLAFPPYDRLPEYFRNCTIFDTTDPVLQVVAAGSEPYLRWIDRPAGGANPQPTSGGQPNTEGLAKGEIPVFFSQASLVLVWHRVPYEYIADPYLPSKILKCMGRVNNENNWLGAFPRGTLKLEAPRIKKAIQAHIRVQSPNHIAPMVCDVMLPFTFVDPDPAPVVDGGGAPTTPKFRGWNLFPWNKTAKFYSVARIEDTSKGQFEYADFDTMFEHVGAP